MSAPNLTTKTICPRCKQNVVLEPIFCSGCNSSYHPGCAKLTPVMENGSFSKCCKSGSRSSSPIPPSGVDYIMEAIKNLDMKISSRLDTMNACFEESLTRIANTEVRVEDLSTRLTNVEGKLRDIIPTVDNVNINSISSLCLSEINNRTQKEKNLVFFGLPEHVTSGESSANSINNNNSDNVRSHLITTLKNVIPPSNFDNVKMIRLGKIVQGQERKPRPVKLICATAERARALLQTFVDAKRDQARSPSLKDMWMSQDRTRMELDAISKIKDQLSTRLQNGEKDLIMVFRRGIPVIIKKNLNQPRSASQTMNLIPQ